jgi:hypothetical protein
MSSQEYLVTGRATEGFEELLEVVRCMPGVEVKKTGSRYVVLEASERDVEDLRNRLGSSYEIAPNRDLDLFKE